MSLNPFSREPQLELKQPKNERRTATPEWEGAYARRIHETVKFQVKETAKALVARPSNATLTEAKARISMQRQLTPDMLRV